MINYIFFDWSKIYLAGEAPSSSGGERVRGGVDFKLRKEVSDLLGKYNELPENIARLDTIAPDFDRVSRGSFDAISPITVPPEKQKFDFQFPKGTTISAATKFNRGGFKSKGIILPIGIEGIEDFDVVKIPSGSESVNLANMYTGSIKNDIITRFVPFIYSHTMSGILGSPSSDRDDYLNEKVNLGGYTFDVDKYNNGTLTSADRELFEFFVKFYRESPYNKSANDARFFVENETIESFMKEVFGVKNAQEFLDRFIEPPTNYQGEIGIELPPGTIFESVDISEVEAMTVEGHIETKARDIKLDIPDDKRMLFADWKDWIDYRVYDMSYAAGDKTSEVVTNILHAAKTALVGVSRGAINFSKDSFGTPGGSSTSNLLYYFNREFDLLKTIFGNEDGTRLYSDSVVLVDKTQEEINKLLSSGSDLGLDSLTIMSTELIELYNSLPRGSELREAVAYVIDNAGEGITRSYKKIILENAIQKSLDSGHTGLIYHDGNYYIDVGGSIDDAYKIEIGEDKYIDEIIIAELAEKYVAGGTSYEFFRRLLDDGTDEGMGIDPDEVMNLLNEKVFNDAQLIVNGYSINFSELHNKKAEFFRGLYSAYWENQAIAKSQISAYVDQFSGETLFGSELEGLGMQNIKAFLINYCAGNITSKVQPYMFLVLQGDIETNPSKIENDLIRNLYPHLDDGSNLRKVLEAHMDLLFAIGIGGKLEQASIDEIDGAKTGAFLMRGMYEFWERKERSGRNLLEDIEDYIRYATAGTNMSESQKIYLAYMAQMQISELSKGYKKRDIVLRDGDVDFTGPRSYSSLVNYISSEYQEMKIYLTTEGNPDITFYTSNSTLYTVSGLPITDQKSLAMYMEFFLIGKLGNVFNVRVIPGGGGFDVESLSFRNVFVEDKNIKLFGTDVTPAMFSDITYINDMRSNPESYDHIFENGGVRVRLLEHSGSYVYATPRNAKEYIAIYDYLDSGKNSDEFMADVLIPTFAAYYANIIQITEQDYNFESRFVGSSKEKVLEDAARMNAELGQADVYLKTVFQGLSDTSEFDKNSDGDITVQDFDLLRDLALSDVNTTGVDGITEARVNKAKQLLYRAEVLIRNSDSINIFDKEKLISIIRGKYQNERLRLDSRNKEEENIYESLLDKEVRESPEFARLASMYGMRLAEVLKNPMEIFRYGSPIQIILLSYGLIRFAINPDAKNLGIALALAAPAMIPTMTEGGYDGVGDLLGELTEYASTKGLELTGPYQKYVSKILGLETSEELHEYLLSLQGAYGKKMNILWQDRYFEEVGSYKTGFNQEAIDESFTSMGKAKLGLDRAVNQIGFLELFKNAYMKTNGNISGTAFKQFLEGKYYNHRTGKFTDLGLLHDTPASAKYSFHIGYETLEKYSRIDHTEGEGYTLGHALVRYWEEFDRWIKYNGDENTLDDFLKIANSYSNDGSVDRMKEDLEFGAEWENDHLDVFVKDNVLKQNQDLNECPGASPDAQYFVRGIDTDFLEFDPVEMTLRLKDESPRVKAFTNGMLDFKNAYLVCNDKGKVATSRIRPQILANTEMLNLHIDYKGAFLPLMKEYLSDRGDDSNLIDLIKAYHERTEERLSKYPHFFIDVVRNLEEIGNLEAVQRTLFQVGDYPAKAGDGPTNYQWYRGGKFEGSDIPIKLETKKYEDIAHFFGVNRADIHKNIFGLTGESGPFTGTNTGFNPAEMFGDEVKAIKFGNRIFFRIEDGKDYGEKFIEYTEEGSKKSPLDQFEFFKDGQEFIVNPFLTKKEIKKLPVAYDYYNEVNSRIESMPDKGAYRSENIELPESPGIINLSEMKGPLKIEVLGGKKITINPPALRQLGLTTWDPQLEKIALESVVIDGNPPKVHGGLALFRQGGDFYMTNPKDINSNDAVWLKMGEKEQRLYYLDNVSSDPSVVKLEMTLSIESSRVPSVDLDTELGLLTLEGVSTMTSTLVENPKGPLGLIGKELIALDQVTLESQFPQVDGLSLGTGSFEKSDIRIETTPGGVNILTIDFDITTTGKPIKWKQDILGSIRYGYIFENTGTTGKYEIDFTTPEIVELFSENNLYMMRKVDMNTSTIGTGGSRKTFRGFDGNTIKLDIIDEFGRTETGRRGSPELKYNPEQLNDKLDKRASRVNDLLESVQDGMNIDLYEREFYKKLRKELNYNFLEKTMIETGLIESKDQFEISFKYISALLYLRARQGARIDSFSSAMVRRATETNPVLDEMVSHLDGFQKGLFVALHLIERYRANTSAPSDLGGYLKNFEKEFFNGEYIQDVLFDSTMHGKLLLSKIEGNRPENSIL